MKGLTYKNNNDSVPLSFKYYSHENLSIGDVASVSAQIQSSEILLSLVVAAHVKIGSGDATVADMVMPAGIWPLVIDRGDTVSVLKLTGSDSGQASVIIPEG
jgi:hypothetical protein